VEAAVGTGVGAVGEGRLDTRVEAGGRVAAASGVTSEI